MKMVRLPFKRDQKEETERGVLISRWLKEQGLKMSKDYTWMVNTKERELNFMFNGEAESWATMLVMKEL
jgi:hypothetical protein